MALKKAVKSEAKLRMAIVGPAGSGKTFTALRLATGLAQGKPIALFDTEHGSAAKYADDFDFDVDNIAAPFHPDKFCQALQAAVDGGYGVVILDSLSHAWNGPGGLLNIVEGITARMKNPNSYAAWKDATPIQDRLIQSLVSANIHVIVTMRSKTDYVLQDNGRGGQAPKKVGMAPIQRDGMDYEFDVVMEMDASNQGIITKTRCSALNEGVFSKPGKDVAGILVKWLAGNPQPAEQTQHRGPEGEVEFMNDAPTGTQAATEAHDAKSPAFKRFHAEGTKTYGKLWDDGRHWLIERYTTRMTPDNVRTSANDLSDDELDVLADALIEKRSYYQKEFRAAGVATGK